jgi:radical SAM protein with 4Fe4S-binding SPASM domain
MNEQSMCIFDLDGTLYPKNSMLTDKIRENVINRIAEKNNISFQKASSKYFSLSTKYPNPYKGLASLGITPNEYQEAFNSIDSSKYLSEDILLQSLLRLLSQNCCLKILTFSPKEYATSTLKALGVLDLFHDIICIDSKYDFEKKEFYEKNTFNNLQNVFVIGDDYDNDILPAIKKGLNAFQVSFEEEHRTIYYLISEIISIYKTFIIPQTMRVETSSICNERCIICPYENMTRAHGKMSFELFKKIIKEHSSSVKDPRLLFPASVGEPFLDIDFIKFVSYASKFYSSIATFSNGSLLTKEKVEQYIKNGGTELMLTLHGYNRENHAKITKTNTYEVVKDNILNASRINREFGYPLTIYLDIYSDCNPDSSDVWLDELYSNHVLINLAPMNNTHNWGGKIAKEEAIYRTTSCNRIYKQFGVQHNGDVVACCADVNGDYVLGNANNNSLTNIFNQFNYIKLCALNQNKKLFSLPTCKICDIK